MGTIAIIDDNVEQSGTLKITIEHYLKKYDSGLNVITQFPFLEIESYFNFIDEKDICVLILDERLNDQTFDGEGPVNYKGNQLVTEIRKRLKDFPIFMITTYPKDLDLIEKDGEFEYIIQREEFITSGDHFIPIIIRAANRFLKTFSDELSEFNKLAKEIAGGNEDPTVLKRLEALQVKLQLPMSDFNDRESWLKEYEEHIQSLEALKIELEKKFKS
jgi:hypothetical protein